MHVWSDEAYNRLFITNRFPDAYIRYGVDDIRTMHTMTRDDIGVAALPCHIADPDPVLRQVVAEPMLEVATDRRVLYHPDAKRVARVKLFTDFLIEQLCSIRPLLEGEYQRVWGNRLVQRRLSARANWSCHGRREHLPTAALLAQNALGNSRRNPISNLL